MSALPNSHEALLRNRHRLTGRIGLLGVRDARLLSHFETPGLAFTDHAGVYESIASVDGWLAAFGYDDGTLQAGSIDSVVVFLPKARAELDLRLTLALWLAAPGALLMLIGEKKEGIAGAVKQLKALAPSAAKVDSARHCQVWCADDVRPSASFDLSDWLSWSRVSHRDTSVDVAGLPGVFSLGRLDEGTSLLLDSLMERPLHADRILDFACGAGVIGSWLQVRQRDTGQAMTPVDGVDVQSQALICARETYRRNGCEGVIEPSDGLTGIQGAWDAIVTNPPFHTGIKTDTSMTERFLESVSNHLKPGGELRLVANHFLPYEEPMKRHLTGVERVLESGRFTVYRAFRR
ncbi:MAG: class I SAM-dependent methyltransferase [Marinobacter sp.]|nr:class I SAM-dependent methyltransferase [Marinobacter sp.]